MNGTKSFSAEYCENCGCLVEASDAIESAVDEPVHRIDLIEAVGEFDDVVETTADELRECECTGQIVKRWYVWPASQIPDSDYEPDPSSIAGRDPDEDALVAMSARPVPDDYQELREIAGINTNSKITNITMAENNGTRLDKDEQQEISDDVRRALQFWDQYDIPFEFGTAIKVRRSGLLRGSWGDGRARDTVVHMHVKDAFQDGRLSRSSDSYLCEKGSHVCEQSKEKTIGDGVEQKVTCETCLKRMKRWEVGEQ